MKLIHIENKIDVLEIKKIIDESKREEAIEILREIRAAYAEYRDFRQDTLVNKIANKHHIILEHILF